MSETKPGSSSQIVIPKSKDYFQLPLISENGFREYDVRWLIDKEINYQGILVLGKAFGTQLQQEYNVKDVVVGFDYRKYSQNVKNAFVVGLMSTGMNVIDINMVLSPITYFAQYYLNVKGCAMITASHNENGWTGIKLGYDLSKTFGPDAILKFKNIVYSGDFLEGRGSYTSRADIIEKYIEEILKSFKLRKKLKVVLATGNGTAGMVMPQVLRRAGVEVSELHTDLDWDFPNFNPNPEDLGFLESIGKAVREVKADFGIGIDGDGDRLGIVDEHGEEVFSDKVGLLLARDLTEKIKNATIVVDVKTTGLFLVDEVLKKNNAKIVYWKTGHSYIKAKVQELNAMAGFEKSGHMFLSSPIGNGYDDACLASAQFCNVISNGDKTVSQLLAALTKSFQSPTMAPYCDDRKKYDVVEGIRKSYVDDMQKGKLIAGSKIKEIIDVNGVRFVLDDNSWGLVRASSNKPSLVIVIESFGTKKRLYDIFDDIKSCLAKFSEVGAFDQTLPPYEE